MGSTTTMRFREYKITTVDDPLSLPTFSAECVTGEETDCGVSSGEGHSAEHIVRWIARHCAETGHQMYERHTRATIRADPGPWH
ncbi:hypothetical protein [Streptacidiphilus sp. EB129]|uniref:DUF7848 domain-containing protein n=1 Tax=Streptacidiphilus sp. EB129 TaxID=3156262 RepID=UPI0035111B91